MSKTVEGEGREGGERQRRKVRNEEQDFLRQSVNFKFFLLLGTHSVITFIVSDC